MPKYARLNNILGWTAFIIAFITYLLTIEETASFWDPGEFIAVAYKLQVPHPPGAPFFLLIYRMFSFFSLGDSLAIAYWMNVGSALFSAFTILFLFWTITLLGRKLLSLGEEEPTKEQTYQLMGAGLIGALAYTFSDSFWFSAVEAEVYAMSSFFTAIVIWAFLKWDVIKDPRAENQYMIFIAYLVGLSIGVHLLNLVTLPALALVVYFKKYKNHNLKGGIIAFVLGGIALVIINNIIIPGLPSIAGTMEIFFVNSLGLPFGSGIVCFSILFLGGLVYALAYAQRQKKVILSTVMICLTFILIGYGSYALIVIRANAEPVINENDPKDIISFVSYLKREQYGYRPLLHGQYFTAEVIDQVEGAPVYAKGEEKYEVVDYQLENIYDPEKTTILPRIYSTQARHQQIYQSKLGLREGEDPTFFDNIYFMLDHQLGHMYWRYFMWNFSGRESDFSDSPFLSIWTTISTDFPEYIKNNKGHNNYFMLPLLLGLIGMFFQARHDPKSFWLTLMLFLMMGVILVLYLNSPPVEPRERDYIYVGSYYAFAIWIGFSVLAISRQLGRLKKDLVLAGLYATLIALPVPLLMAGENWNDHDRSNRFFSVDSARNFLASCAPNAILFTGGDNDTFPLWYVQEVEGFRTDVRVIVLSYFDTDWYVKQMTRPVNESAALDFTLQYNNFKKGTNDVLYITDRLNNLSLPDYLKLLKSDSELLKLSSSRSGSINTVPSRTLSMSIDQEKIENLDIVPEQFRDLRIPEINIRLKGNYVTKGNLMLLDLIATNNWERPIYFNNTSLATVGFDISDHVVMEGLTYRLLPIQKPDNQEELINTELAYNNVTEKFAFRGMNDPDNYFDDEFRRFTSNHRSVLNSITMALMDEGDMQRAEDIMRLSLEKFPHEAIPYDLASGQAVPLLFELGMEEEAMHIIDEMSSRSVEMLDFYQETGRAMDREASISMQMLRYFIPLLNDQGFEDKANQLQQEYERLFGSMGQQMQRR